MADTGNIVDDILTDHREFESVFTEIESSGDPRTQPDLVEHVIAGIVRHAVAEEQYLYPAARKVLSNGDEIADHELEEHAEAEEIMKAIEKAGEDDPQYDDLVRKLIGEIRHHIEDEENDLLAELRDACPPEELQAWRPPGRIRWRPTTRRRTRSSPPVPGWWTGFATPSADATPEGLTLGFDHLHEVELPPLGEPEPHVV